MPTLRELPGGPTLIMAAPINCTRTPEATIISFSQPNFLEESVVQEIQDALDVVIRSDGDRFLVLDMSAVRFVSSRFLGLLVKLSGMRRPGGGKIALAGLQENLKEPFRITRLDRRFDFYPTLDAAKAALEQVPVIDASADSPN
jgi:anti-anti-sigma factor